MPLQLDPLHPLGLRSAGAGGGAGTSTGSGLPRYLCQEKAKGWAVQDPSLLPQA